MRGPLGVEAILSETVEPTVVSERPKVVYTLPPLQLARLLGEVEGGWNIEIGGGERRVEASADVDPALLREVAARKGRVLVETSEGAPKIAGVLQVRRALEIDASGDVEATVRSMRVRAKREIQLTTERALIWIKGEDIEIYGKEVLTRAREVAKILGRLISLN